MLMTRANNPMKRTSRNVTPLAFARTAPFRLAADLGRWAPTTANYSISLRALASVTLIFSSAVASETFLVRAKALDYFDAPYACPENEICLGYLWFRYEIDGWSIESGEVVQSTVSGSSHTWIRTDAPWIVTLEPTAGKSKYDFLEVDYVIKDVDVFDHFVCPDDSHEFPSAMADVTYADNRQTDEQDADQDGVRECYSYYSILDALPDPEPTGR